MKQRLKEILDNYKLTDWEETSLAYCKLMLIKQRGGGKAIVVCDDAEWEESAIRRSLQNFGISISKVYTTSMLASASSRKSLEAEDASLPIISTKDVCSWFPPPPSANLLVRCLRKARLIQRPAAIDIKNDILRVHFPYWRIRREQIYLYAQKNVAELEQLAQVLGDDLSRDTLYEIIRCSADNDFFRIKEGNQDEKYFECFEHLDDEVWVNCGSAVGDTVLKYVGRGYKFEKIYAYEGGQNIFKGLEEIIGRLPEKTKAKIELRNNYIGLDHSDNCFDKIFADKRVTFINMDIEGAEMGVLRGARELIKSQRPVLAVCAYHKTSDLLDIPRYIGGICNDYFFFMRKYHGFELNALNEYLYYAVPKERLLKRE